MLKVYNNNIYALGRDMWRGLGEVGQVGESATDVYSRMTPITFESRPFGVMLNGEIQDTGKHYAIVRTGGEKEVVVGNTKGRYNITQPIEYAQTFDKYVGKSIESMGFLGTNGQRMFLTSELPAVDVFGDRIDMYLFCAFGFDGVFGEKVYQTNIRFVCTNMWNKIVADSKNRFCGVSFKHNQKNHLEDLGIWMRYITKQAEENVKIYEGLYRKMESTPLSIDQAGSLFSKVYSKKDSLGAFHPDELREKNQGTIDEYNAKQDESVEIAMELFKGAGIQITRTVYGALNSVTELENRHRASKKPIAESILIGNRQNTMSYALDIMTEYVEVRK